jgi:hypothetical protein
MSRIIQRFHIKVLYSVLAICFLLLVPIQRAEASHIVGGQISLIYKGPGLYDYTFRLTTYFDNIGAAPGTLNNLVSIVIYDRSTSPHTAIAVLQPPRTQDEIYVPYSNPLCANNNQIQTRILTYEQDITLDPALYGNSAGYYAVFQTCCRTSAITNLDFPGSTGNTFYLSFPPVVIGGVPIRNSTPSVFGLLTSYGCVGQPYTADYSATDLDGDSLVYSLIEPFRESSVNGGDGEPYETVTWGTGFSLSNMIPGLPSLGLDRRTGRLSVTPLQQGLFVFGVQVEEYRNGQLLSVCTRDFQMLVKDCPANGIPQITVNPPPLGTGIIRRDTIVIQSPGITLIPFEIADDSDRVSISITAPNFPPGGLTLSTAGGNTLPGQPLLATISVDGCALSGRSGYFQLITRDNGCPNPNSDTAVYYLILPLLSAYPPKIAATYRAIRYTSTPPQVFTLSAGAGSQVLVEVTDSVVPSSTQFSVIPAGTASVIQTTGVGTSQITYRVGVNLACPRDSNQLFKLVMQAQNSGCALSFIDTIQLRFRQLPPMISLRADSLTCSGAGAQVAALQVGYRYVWNTGDTTQRIVVTQPGKYRLTAQDGLGCPIQDSVTISAPRPLSVRINGASQICIGQTASLSALVTTSLGQLPVGRLRYRWSRNLPADTLPTLVNATAGTYTIFVTGDRGCIGQQSLTVTTTTLPALGLPRNPRICPGQRLLLDANTGLRVQWSTGDTSRAITVSSPGQIRVRVFGGQGCERTDTITVGQYSPPRPGILAGALTCQGLGASLGLSRSYVRYRWSTGDTVRRSTADLPGTYRIAVTDSNGCAGQDSLVVAVVGSLAVRTGNDALLCQGSDRTLTAQVVGGTGQGGNFSYRWSTLGLGDTLASLRIRTGGSYSVEVRNGRGCMGADTIRVQSVPLPVTGLGRTAGLCVGSSRRFGVRPGYAQYSWSTGAVSDSIAIGGPGNYRVLVTDSNGCVRGDTLVVQSIVPILPVLVADTLRCTGGPATIRVTNPLQNYRWSDGSTGARLLTERAGQYSLQGTDANGCAVSEQTRVLLRGQLRLEVDGPPVVCAGDTVRLQARVLVAGAGPRILWNTGDTLANIGVARGGAFIARITNSRGCSGADTINVVLGQRPNLNVPSTARFCPGTSLIIAASPGSVSYDWSTGDTSRSVRFFSPGRYTVRGRSVLGCPSTDTVEVTTYRVVAELQFTAMPCYGGNGAVVSSPNPMQRYRWSTGDTGQTTLYNREGYVALQALDINGCRTSDSVYVQSPFALDVAVSGPRSICPTRSAVLNATPTVSDPRLTYFWSTGGIGASTVVDTAATYRVTIRNERGCVGEDTIYIALGTIPDARLPRRVAFCPGGSTILACLPGQASQYLWSTGDTTRTIVVNRAGRYTLAMISPLGCPGVDTTEVEVYQPAALRLPAVQLPCVGPGVPLGAVAGRGQPFLQYRWSGGDSGTTTLVRYPGQYRLIATDSNGCVVRDSITVATVGSLPVRLFGGQRICAGGSTQLQVLFPQGTGEEPIRYGWSMATGSGGDSTVGDSIRVLTGAEAGRYRIRVVNGRGCIGSDTTAVVDAPYPALALPARLEICPGARVNITAQGAQLGYRYRWNTGDTTATVLASRAGLFICRGTTPEGCVGFDSTVVIVRPQPTIDLQGPRKLCPGIEASIAVANSNLYTDYVWVSDSLPLGLQGPAVRVDRAGIYKVLASDAAGCQGSDSLRLTLDTWATPVLSAPAPFCQGTRLVVRATPLPDSALVHWREYATSADTGLIRNQARGIGLNSYSVDSSAFLSATVTSRYGCAKSLEFIVESPLEIPAPFRLPKDTALCAPGRLVVNVPGPVVEGATQRWYNFAGAIISSQPEVVFTTTGSYVAERSNLCGRTRDTINLTVLELPKPIVVSPNDTANCRGTELRLRYSISQPDSVASIVTASRVEVTQRGVRGGVFDLFYLNDSAGFDTITLTSVAKNGCSASTSVRIHNKICGAGFFVPTAFSPQGDGRNDTLRLAGFQIAKARIVIINRWGNIVFEANDFNPATQLFATMWLGKYKNEDSPEGVYKLYLEYTPEDPTQPARKQTTNLLLMR